MRTNSLALCVCTCVGDDTEVEGRAGFLDIASPSTVTFCCAGTSH